MDGANDEVSTPAPTSGQSPAGKQVSCGRCKQRKAKCDRQLPECYQCQRSGSRCEYTARKRPGFSSGHRMRLETNIRNLELKLATLVAKGHGYQGSGDEQTPAPSVEEPGSRAKSPRGPNYPFSTGAQLKSSGLHDRSGPEPPFGDAANRLGTSIRTQRIKERRPPPDLVYSLASLYFHHIHPWLPFLDARHVFTDQGPAGQPSFLSYALFGASLSFSQDPRLTREAKESFWKYSKRQILLEALEEPSFRTLEALAVLVLDLSGMTNGPQVWGVLAVAIKFALQLKPSNGHGLRASTLTMAKPTQPEYPAVQGLFRAVYAMDCYISITTPSAPGLTDQQISHLGLIQDPIWYGDADLGSIIADEGCQFGPPYPKKPILCFSYQLQLLNLSRRFHRLHVKYCSLGNELTATVTALDQWLQSLAACSAELHNWYMALPPALSLDLDWHLEDGSDPDFPLLFMLHAYHHALNIYCHGLVLFSPHPSLNSHLHGFGFGQSSRADCDASVVALAHIVNQCTASPHITESLGWPFAWATFVAARYCLVSRYEGRTSMRELFSVFLAHLELMGGHWQISGHYNGLLRTAHDELERMEVGDGGEVGRGEAPRLLRMMVDWRVTTCELEDQSRIDPIISGASEPPLFERISPIDLTMMLQDTGSNNGQLFSSENLDSWF